jgi:uncharacterized membrane protein
MMPLHPSIVHFPPVLLLAAAVLYALGLWRKQTIFQVTGFGFHVAGLVFCIVAIFTGDFESSKITAGPELKELMERHENLLMVATYGFGMLGIWAFLRQKSNFTLERIGFVTVFVALLGLMLFGAHQGGKMVYLHGAGTATFPSAVPGTDSQVQPSLNSPTQ